MEEKFELRLSMEGGVFEVEEFYEQIEAPKYVDFSIPNHFSPDDRFWFCSRLGCDQIHEEQLDSEAIYKNFVLRVMAARSPNVRFRRALTRKPPSESKKCPLSAPPKPSKSRLPRLALVNASISKKLINEENGKVKAPPASVKPASTPKPRAKHVAAKYMTSPRMRKGRSPNPNAFRSVRNPKKLSILLPKSKIIAKALVFNSPKKALKKQPSSELGTPISKLCEGVKKLQINNQKKGIDRKPSKDCTSEINKLPLGSSKKIPISSKVKKQEFDAKISKSVKSKVKLNDRKHADVALLEVGKSGDESSDMEIDEKSTCGSLELGLETIKPQIRDKYSSQEEGTSSSERSMTGGNSETESSDTQKKKRNSGSDSEDKVSAKENSVPTQAPTANEQDEEKSDSNSDDLENQNPRVVSELKEDNKENALNSTDIRNLNRNNFSKQEEPVKPKVKTKQTPQKLDKNSKENCPAGTGTQGLKNRKLKPTNPKPFRLRTDERGILKEATLERKVNSHENSSTTNDNSKGMGNGASDNREKRSKKDVGMSLKKDQLKLIRSRYKNLKGVEQKSFLQKQVEGPQRNIVSNVKFREISTIEKPKATMLRSKESRKQGKDAVDLTNKASITQKSAAQGKRLTTIPREPNFQSLHKPKSCIRNKP